MNASRILSIGQRMYVWGVSFLILAAFLWVCPLGLSWKYRLLSGLKWELLVSATPVPGDQVLRVDPATALRVANAKSWVSMRAMRESEKVIDVAIEGNAKDPRLYLARAKLRSENGDFSGSIADLQVCRSLVNAPTGIGEFLPSTSLLDQMIAEMKEKAARSTLAQDALN